MSPKELDWLPPGLGGWKLSAGTEEPDVPVDAEFVAASTDLGNYEIFPEGGRERLTMVVLGMRVDPLVVAVKGSQWAFHKNDADPWPSTLHAHHSRGGIKLDAVSGDLFRIEGRKHIGRVKDRDLSRIQLRLLASKDFADKARQLIGEARVAALMKAAPG